MSRQNLNSFRSALIFCLFFWHFHGFFLVSFLNDGKKWKLIGCVMFVGFLPTVSGPKDRSSRGRAAALSAKRPGAKKPAGQKSIACIA